MDFNQVFEQRVAALIGKQMLDNMGQQVRIEMMAQQLSEVQQQLAALQPKEEQSAQPNA